MLESTNLKSKTTLHVDENGRFKYFFVFYGAWILGFQYLRKVIAIDGTFLRSEYNGVLLAAMAQDVERHIFPITFCVANKECDTSYGYFYEQMQRCIKDTEELCFLSNRHPSITKIGFIFYTSVHFGCCMRHRGDNIRNNFYNEIVMTLFYRAAKTYNRDEFFDHFNHIMNIHPKAAEHLIRVGFERYNIMTSNIIESVNSLFGIEREFSIVTLFDEINKKYGKLFHKSRVQFAKTGTRFILEVEKQISMNTSLGNRLFPHHIVDDKFSIDGYSDVATINLQTRSYIGGIGGGSGCIGGIIGGVGGIGGVGSGSLGVGIGGIGDCGGIGGIGGGVVGIGGIGGGGDGIGVGVGGGVGGLSGNCVGVGGFRGIGGGGPYVVTGGTFVRRY
ncbi:hypothetical protein FXO37_14487 [Capsicum annuum]|nr:hypothetical protein FXO37_14487 [Capsicum annuum]